MPPGRNAAARLYPGRSHFERWLSSGTKHDPYDDPNDPGGDERRPVSRTWDAPTANFVVGGRDRPVVGTKPARECAGSIGLPVDAAGLQTTSRAPPRPRSATVAGRAAARGTPRREAIAVDDGSECATPRTDASAARESVAESRNARPASRPRNKPAATIMPLAARTGRDAPLPGHIASIGAPSAVTTAMLEGHEIEAQQGGPRRRARGQRDRAVAERMQRPGAVSGGLQRAMIKHGAPFEWLRSFDFHERAGQDTHVASPRLGPSAGPKLYGNEGAQEARQRRASVRASSAVPQPPSERRAAPPKPLGYRSIKRLSGKPRAAGAPAVTDWHSGDPSTHPRASLCAADMARASGRASGGAAATGGGPLSLTALDTALAYQQRHKATPDIGKTTPRPPLNRPSASSGMSLFVKYDLVEPTVPAPRFASPTEARQRPSTAPARRAVPKPPSP